MTDVDGILNLLDGVQRTSENQYNAKCPAHDDKQASLSVGVTTDRYLLHCHAGCPLGQILISMNLEWRDIFLAESNGNGNNPHLTGPVQLHRPVRPVSRRRDDHVTSLPTPPMISSWADAVVQVASRLYEVKGWSLQTLRALQIGWDGARVTIPVRGAEGELSTVMRYLPGGRPKMLALGGCGRHLYPAPEMFQGGPVWLVEGEPDSISARELGLPAVSVPGVGKWCDEWTERFRPLRVTVCFDADREGRGAARARVDDFRCAGVEARAVDIAPGRTDGFDLGDALVMAVRERRVEDLRSYLARLWYEAWAS